MIKKLFCLLLFLFSPLCFKAQDTAAAPQMADSFRAEGKIYVVITVISIIFLAIVAFLIYLERKIKKLEREFKKD